MTDHDIWGAFTMGLAATLATLEHEHTIILNYRGVYFLQLFLSVSEVSDYAILHGEVLSESDEFTDAEVACLAGLGWNAPESPQSRGWGRWWIDYKWPCAGRDCRQLARLCADTLRQYCGAINLDGLAYKAFNPVTHEDLDVPVFAPFPRLPR